MWKDNKVINEYADLLLYEKVDKQALISELDTDQERGLMTGHQVRAKVENSWLMHTEINDEII